MMNAMPPLAFERLEHRALQIGRRLNSAAGSADMMNTIRCADHHPMGPTHDERDAAARIRAPRTPRAADRKTSQFRGRERRYDEYHSVCRPPSHGAHS